MILTDPKCPRLLHHLILIIMLRSSPKPAPTVSCKINGVEMPASSNSTVLSQVSIGCLDDSSIEDLGKSEWKTLICLR